MTPDSERKAAHSEFLAVFIREVLDEAKLDASQIDALAISGGPGSYTGLRIGTSSAKGFCFASGIKLLPINTLQIIAAMALAKCSSDFDYIVPMIDARRMEVYTALVDGELNLCSNVEAKIIDENSFSEYAGKKLVFCGNGASKCSEVLKNENFVFLNDIYPSAEYMGKLAEAAFAGGQFADLAYYEPFYLKEFVATTSKKSLF